MHKRGLPINAKMRHDSHYVEELNQTRRFIGRLIPVNRIEPNPEQPRTEIGDLSELTSSIKEKGVLEPLLVKPLGNSDRWLIIAGERRWRAARLAGLNEVPCIELDVDEQSVAEIALIENLQRKDLTIWEEADALLALCQKFGYTHEDLAKKIGKSRSSVTESLSIANLPHAVRERCLQNGIVSKSNLLQIARKFDESEMLEAISVLSESTSSQNRHLNSYSGVIEMSNQSQNSTKSSAKGVIRPVDFPIRLYSYIPEDNKFKIEVKFKKAASKIEIIEALQRTIETLENH